MGLEERMFVYQQAVKTAFKTKLPPVDLPGVVVIPGTMINHWSPKLKLVALMLVLGVYIYFIFIVRTIYIKHKRLNHISDMMSETQKMINNVHSMDQQLAVRIARLENLLDDYHE